MTGEQGPRLTVVAQLTLFIAAQMGHTNCKTRNEDNRHGEIGEPTGPERLVHAYNRMMERVQSVIEQAEGKVIPTLQRNVAWRFQIPVHLRAGKGLDLAPEMGLNKRLNAFCSPPPLLLGNRSPAEANQVDIKKRTTGSETERKESDMVTIQVKK